MQLFNRPYCSIFAYIVFLCFLSAIVLSHINTIPLKNTVASLYRFQFSYYNFPVTPYTDGLKTIWCAHFQFHGYNIRWLAPTVQAVFEAFAAESCTYQWRSYSLKHRLGSTDSEIRLRLFWIQEINYCRLKTQLRVSWKAQWYPLLPFIKHCKILIYLKITDFPVW